MPKFFVKEDQIKNNVVKIIGTDINHIKNVLRLKENDKIEICNSENQANYLCQITTINDEQIECNIINEVIENR